MDINSYTNQKFTGAYRFKPMPAKYYEELKRLVPLKSRIIFDNVKENGDIVHVNHSCYDQRVQNFIKKKGIGFEYYPKIKLSDKLTKGILYSLIKRDTAQNDVIKNMPALKSLILKDNILRSKSAVNHIDDIFKTLRLNVDNPKFVILKNGLPKIVDKSKERSIYLSTNYTSKYYVYVKPNSQNQPSSRYLLYENGKKFVKEYNTPEEITNFNKLSCIISD